MHSVYIYWTNCEERYLWEVHTFIQPCDIIIAIGVMGKLLRQYLHVSSLCSFHSGVHQALPSSHGVEEELCGCQTRIKAVGHKTLSSRQL